MRELSEIPALRTALGDARDYTLQLYAHLTPEQRRFPRLLSVNRPRGASPHRLVPGVLVFAFPGPRRAAAGPPHRCRRAPQLFDHAACGSLGAPGIDLGQVLEYLEREFQDTLAALEQSTPEQRYFFQLALLHEDMHGEALTYTRQTLAYPAPSLALATCLPSLTPPPPAGALPGDVGHPRRGVTGSVRAKGPRFASTTRSRLTRATSEPFRLARAPVTNEEYRALRKGGRLQPPSFWTAEGWQWRLATRRAPGCWRTDGAQWPRAPLRSTGSCWVPTSRSIHVNAGTKPRRTAPLREPGCRPRPSGSSSSPRPRRATSRLPMGRRCARRPPRSNLDGAHGGPVAVASVRRALTASTACPPDHRQRLGMDSD